MVVPKSNIKKRNDIAILKFDTDLSGLHKPEQSVEILGKQLRFRAPGIIQKAMTVRFIVLSLQDIVSTDIERQAMSYDSLWLKCITKLGELNALSSNPAELEQQQLILGRMFANTCANEYLLKAIAQSFPDLNEPELLTDEALMQVATVLITHMQITN